MASNYYELGTVGQNYTIALTIWLSCVSLYLTQNVSKDGTFWTRHEPYLIVVVQKKPRVTAIYFCLEIGFSMKTHTSQQSGTILVYKKALAMPEVESFESCSSNIDLYEQAIFYNSTLSLKKIITHYPDNLALQSA